MLPKCVGVMLNYVQTLLRTVAVTLKTMELFLQYLPSLDTQHTYAYNITASTSAPIVLLRKFIFPTTF